MCKTQNFNTMAKIIDILNGFVTFVKSHAFPAFIGMCFAILNIGVAAYLFYDKHYLFAVVAIITIVLGIVPFAYDCANTLTDPDKAQNE